MNARTSLSCDASSAACARRFVADVLSSGGFDNGCVEDAVLLSSEVVTNAIVHAGTDLDLVIVADHPMARVEVYDSHPSLPVPIPPSAESTRGLGIQVVEALAEAWGVEQLNGGGKCVWFELRS